MSFFSKISEKLGDFEHVRKITDRAQEGIEHARQSAIGELWVSYLLLGGGV